jgi:secreted trypsin-like serine protease
MTILNKINISLSCLTAFITITSYLVASSAIQADERELNTRIMGGTIANAKRYPYYTFIEITTSSLDAWRCGGTLVAVDAVLTSGHCVNGQINSITATVNYTQSHSTGSKTGYEYSRNVSHYVTHRDFSNITYENDITILMLDDPVFEVSPVNLNEKSNVPSVGTSVTAFGHGWISNAVTPEYPDYLMEVSISIVSFQDCNDANSWNGFIRDDLMICSGHSTGGKGICQGDTGVPLIIRGNSASQDIQVGIGSFVNAAGCVLANYPAGFARVSHYTQWVKDTVCQKSKFKPTYCPTVAPKPTKKPSTSKPRRTNRPSPTPTLKGRTRKPSI